MKILMLTPYLPYPPSSGGQIRSYNLIKQLAKEHEITLCSLIKYEEERKYVEKLKPFCKEIYVFKRAEKPWTLNNILNTGFSFLPFLVIRNFSMEQKKFLKKLLSKESFDIIHAETFYVYPHIPKTQIPVVLVAQTIEYQVYSHFANKSKYFFLRPLFLIDVAKIKFWETYYWKKSSRVIAVSERDGKVMRSLVKGLKVTVVPNGVGDDLMVDVPLHFKKTILFMGNYAWLQNIEAAQILAREVFPKIAEKIPDVKLIIAGQNTDKVADLKSENILLQDIKGDDIEGVKEAYQNNGIMVAPLYGPGGTRLKILAAMAAKMPVVTTEVGNEGIDGKDEVSILTSNSKDKMVWLAIKLLTDQTLYKKIAMNARKLVEEKYAYQSISKKLSDIYKEFKND